MMIKLTHPIVSVTWLNDNVYYKNLIVIDATIKRAVDDENKVDQNLSIKNARFLDIKKVFSKIEAPFPNTMLNIEEFEEKARELGVNKNSAIVVYDQYGYYSTLRV